MKKLLCISLCLMMALSVMAGCGTPAPANSTAASSTATSSTAAESTATEAPAPESLSGEFTHWTYTDMTVFEADEFMKAYPEIKVDLQVFGGDEYENKIRSALASGGSAMPDSFDLEEGYVGKYIDIDQIADLGPLGVNNIVGNIYPYLMAMGTDSNGVIKGIANNIAPVAFWYNRAAAKEWLGTDDADEIGSMLSSWDKIFEVAQKVKDDSNGTVWLWGSMGEVPKLMSPSMPSFIDANEKFVFDDKWLEMTHVMRKFWDEKLEGNLNSWSGEWASAWNDGTLIIRVMPSWDFFSSDENKAAGNIGVAKPPSSAFEGATIRLISNDSAKKELAYAFIEYGVSSEFQKANLDINNQVPCNLEVIDELRDNYSSPTFGGQNIMKTYDEIAQGIPANTYNKYSRELINKFGKACSDGIKEGRSDEEIVENFKAVVRDMFPELGA